MLRVRIHNASGHAHISHKGALCELGVTGPLIRAVDLVTHLFAWPIYLFGFDGVITKGDDGDHYDPA